MSVSVDGAPRVKKFGNEITKRSSQVRGITLRVFFKSSVVHGSRTIGLFSEYTRRPISHEHVFARKAEQSPFNFWRIFQFLEWPV